MDYSLNIALIEPEIPQNTGNIARTCAATGAKLHLVGPMGFTITDKQVKRAGLDYWDKLDITYYDSTEEFFEKNKGADFYYFSTKAEQAHSFDIIFAKVLLVSIKFCKKGSLIITSLIRVKLNI
jgi:tRNA (cytidine/uridine-2'-O-)-methyltransferase